MIEMNGERESEKSVLAAAQHDDNDEFKWVNAITDPR